MGTLIVLYCLFSEFNQLFQLICAVIAAHVLDCFITVRYGGHNVFCMCDCIFCDFMMAELGGVSESLAIYGFNVA